MNSKKYQHLEEKQYIKLSYLITNRNECVNYYDRGLYQYVGDKDLLVWIDYEHQNEYMIIPRGYIFDFGSVPCWGRCVSNKDEYMAYLIHDRLFDSDCKIKIRDENNLSPKFQKLQKYGYGFTTKYAKKESVVFNYNRKFADTFLFQLMKEEDINILHNDRTHKHTLVYIAVRIGGEKNFRKRKGMVIINDEL